MSDAGFSKKYNPQTHAVKMASQAIRDVVGTFANDNEGAPFMGVKRSESRQRVHQQIAESPMAMELIRRGYPIQVAHEVAKMEKER